jgi:hypothetical protein
VLRPRGSERADELRCDQSMALVAWTACVIVDRLSFRCRMSHAHPETGELSLYALGKSAVAVSQLCYSPFHGEGRNSGRLALAC